jgi:hypothetical protein
MKVVIPHEQPSKWKTELQFSGKTMTIDAPYSSKERQITFTKEQCEQAILAFQKMLKKFK